MKLPFLLIVFIGLVIYSTEPHLTLKPFSLTFSNWLYTLGWLCIVIGIIIIQTDAASGQYIKGMEKGLDLAHETLIKLLQKENTK
jgi:hypothetical protein